LNLYPLNRQRNFNIQLTTDVCTVLVWRRLRNWKWVCLGWPSIHAQVYSRHQRVKAFWCGRSCLYFMDIMAQWTGRW
jgi:hypothetical protein